MLDLLTPLVRRWRLVLLVPLILTVGAAVVSFLVSPKYTATTTFSQESNPVSGLSGSLASLAGLAGQLGIASGVGGDLTPDFLVSVLESRELLDSTLVSDFADPDQRGEHRSLLDIMQVDGRTPPERMSNGVRMLAASARSSLDRKTGIVTLSVSLRDPELAAAVANRMVELLDRFNVGQRQTQSRQQREFIGNRLTQIERELHDAEQQEIRFLQANREFKTSPLLTFEENRLERQVQMKQEVFLSLTKAYEDARIAEVRDTPSITIIDTAIPPTRRSAPRRKLIVLLGLISGCIIGVAIAYLTELGRSARREGRRDYQALADAWAQARTELMTPLGKSGR